MVFCAATASELEVSEANVDFPALSGPAPDLSEQVKRTNDKYSLPAYAPSQTYSPFGLACDVDFTAAKSDAAMVMLSLRAPCQINTALTVQFQGLMFSGTTSNIGTYSVLVPAITPKSEFRLTLAGTEPVVASVNVPQAGQYTRVAVQWAGNAELQIHAFEFGHLGRKKHVWNGAPQSLAQATQARGGYIVRLGNSAFPNPFHLEIYNFPSAKVEKTGLVRLHLKARVTKENCGQAQAAQILQNAPDKAASVMDISLTMPACDHIGDYLLFKNLLKDLKISSNQW